MARSKTATKDAGFADVGIDQTARSRILLAAEETFATMGYDAASLRQIALQAEVPPGLVAYHFNGKLGLYRAVFERRTPAVVEQRRAGLAMARLEESPGRRLELILKAVLVPMLKLTAQENGGHFALLLAREVSDPRSVERGIVQDMLDPIAHAVIEQIRTALPGHSAAAANWAYQAIIGTMVFVMADGGRISRLSDGAADPKDIGATLHHLVTFFLMGLGAGEAAKGAPTP